MAQRRGASRPPHSERIGIGELAGIAAGDYLAGKPLATLEAMIARRVNAPLSTSAGRLFDAVAALLGICADRQHFEGQAAMELEALAVPHAREAMALSVRRCAQRR